MASDRDGFKFGFSKWESLKQDKYFSNPTEYGKIAIFCATPTETGLSKESSKKRHRKNREIYRREASTIARLALEIDRNSEIIYNPEHEDFVGVLKDPSFSDIITIGDGSLSAFFLEGEPRDFDWFNVSLEADHLKSGYFVQRHCGHFDRDFNLPLGTFAVSSLPNVIAPVGQIFDPRGLQHPDNYLLRRALVDVEMSYPALKTYFSDTSLPPATVQP